MENTCRKCFLQKNQNIENDELRLLTQYIPYKVVKFIGESECCVFDKKITRFEGTVIYFDIIGFTPIVVNYFNQKRDIADLSNTLSEFYSVITETVRGFDGSIYQFAGDSILISFEKAPDETPEKNFKRALTATLRTLELSDNYNSVSKDTNGFTLKPKIGMSYGSYSQILLGHKDLFVTPELVGRAVKSAIECECLCKRQELIIDEKAFEYAKKCNLEKCFSKQDNHYVFSKVDDSFFDNIEYPEYYDVEQLFGKIYFYNRLTSFLNPVIRQQIENIFQGFSGEYKDITCVMARFDGDFVKELGIKVTEECLSPLDAIYTNINSKACKYGGYCMKPDLSDKGVVFPIVFGTPSALEKKERNAILFSTEVIKFGEKNNDIDSVNIGVVTGMVYSGEFGGILRKDYTTIGNSINFASRLMTYNIGKEKYSILVDENTNRVTKDFCITEPVTGITCKGYDGVQTAYRYKNLIEQNNLFIRTGKLFGREEELSILSKELEKSLSNELNFVSLTGDAGIGKTFLIEHFLSMKKNESSDFQIYQATCYQYEQTTSFYCWCSIIRQLMQIPDDLAENIAEMLVRSFFAEHFPEEESWVPSLLNMLGYNISEPSGFLDMEASIKQKYLFSLVYRILLLFGQEPLVIVIENLQWCDLVSLKLLEYMIHNKRDSKIFFVLVSRDSEITKQFNEKNRITRIQLRAITEEASTSLTEYLLNLKEPNIPLVKKIVYSSDGNPFFIENIIRSLLENKTLKDDESGKRYLSANVKNINNIEIPSSIQNIILSRIDSLQFEEQIVCKTAAAIGRTFYSDCLRKILPEGISDSTLDKALSDFEMNNIITRDEEKGKSYVFNHVITHDVIYETILDTTKKELNLMILSYLETKNKDNLYPIIEKLEYHAIESKDYNKIFIYAKSAAEKAEKQSSPSDAISHYSIAENAWKKLDDKKNIDDLYTLELRLAEQYRVIGNYKNAEDLFETIVDKCKQKSIYANALRGLGRCYQERGDFNSSVKTLELALKTLGKRAPKSAFAVYLLIVKEAIVQLVNYGLLKEKVIQYDKEKLEKKKTECDILCVLNKLYYFGMPEKIAWSSVANFNTSLHIAKEQEHLCLACGDYAVSLSSAGLRTLGVNIFEKGFKISQIIDNQKVENIFKARYAYYFLFYNNPKKSISLLEEACDYFKKISEQWELMTAEGALAQNYFLIGEFENSLDAYIETGRLAKELHSSMHLGWAYNKVPFINYITGKSSADEAIKTLLEGIKISSSVNDNMTLCIHYGHLIHIFLKEEKFAEALEFVEETMKENNIYKINIPHIKISYVNVVEGIYYANKSNNIPANKKSYYIKMAEKALKIVTKISKEHQMLLGPVFRAKSMVQLLKNNEKMAREAYLDAIRVLKESPYKWEYKNTLDFGKENNF